MSFLNNLSDLSFNIGYFQTVSEIIPSFLSSVIFNFTFLLLLLVHKNDLACSATCSHYKNHEASVKQSQFWCREWSKISKNFDILASTHASLLQLLHTCLHSAFVCVCFCFCLCICFISVNQAIAIRKTSFKPGQNQINAGRIYWFITSLWGYQDQNYTYKAWFTLMKQRQTETQALCEHVWSKWSSEACVDARVSKLFDILLHSLCQNWLCFTLAWWFL